MILIVSSKVQFVNLSGGRAKFHEIEPGQYQGRVGPAPVGYDQSSSWFYIIGHTSLGANIDFLRGLPSGIVKLIDS
jgi:hypothetical protein